MSFTDPIADMLTRIRNANLLKQEAVTMPSSGLKVRLAAILKDEGFIRGYEVIGDANKQIVISLKYANNGTLRVINGIRRISKPGLRVTAPVDKLPKVIRGLGVAIISTNQGIMTDAKAREKGLGGEVLAYVW
ncbi:MAG: 30S ribosomal protein S8 [Firmicutes bacterium]|nr:30S ribosomal protein S8 [Bacillota bacterium]